MAQIESNSYGSSQSQVEPPRIVAELWGDPPKNPIVVGPAKAAMTVVRPARSIATIGPAPEPIVIAPVVRMDGPATIIRPQQVTTVRASAEPAAVVGPALAVSVEPPRRGAWAERGWIVRDENRKRVYEGDYHTGALRFRGRIEAGEKGKITAYIHNPPAEIKKHRVGPCFQQCGIGTAWFVLHWRRPARNVDEAILYVERVLAEAVRR